MERDHKENTWQKIHQEASPKGESTYIDPDTGYVVFTEHFLKTRGFCCDSGCRHCPYNQKTSESKIK